MFNVGDKVRRTKFNEWWKNRTSDRGTGVFTVEAVLPDTGEIRISIPGWGHTNAAAFYFVLAKEYTKEELLLNKINKLYKKCKTTSHWAKENV